MPRLRPNPPSVFSETFVFAVRFRLRLSDAQSDDMYSCEQTRPAVATLIGNPPGPELSSSEDNGPVAAMVPVPFAAGTPLPAISLLCEVKRLSSDNSSNLVILPLNNL